MDPKDEGRDSPKPHVEKSYEDPHFHDDDDIELDDETAKKKFPPARRLPPPKRWHVED